MLKKEKNKQLKYLTFSIGSTIDRQWIDKGLKPLVHKPRGLKRPLFLLKKWVPQLPFTLTWEG